MPHTFKTLQEICDYHKMDISKVQRLLDEPFLVREYHLQFVKENIKDGDLIRYRHAAELAAAYDQEINGERMKSRTKNELMMICLKNVIKKERFLMLSDEDMEKELSENEDKYLIRTDIVYDILEISRIHEIVEELKYRVQFDVNATSLQELFSMSQESIDRYWLHART